MTFRRILAATLLALAAGTSAQAAFVGTKRALLSGGISKLAPYGPILDMDLVAGWCHVAGFSNYYTPEQCLSVTRTQTGFEQLSNGTWTSFAGGVLRRTDKGVLVEPSATNLLINNRDYTNASWVASNVSTSNTSIRGIDGTANGTKVCATGANGTLLQSVTHASAAESFTIFAERLSGTGEVDITENGGTGWTAIDGSLSSTPFYRGSVEATITNPNVGIRIVRSGDCVIVDMSQLEATTFSTSPIKTAGVSLGRNVDQVIGVAFVNTALSLGAGPYTFFVAATTNDNSANRVLMALGDGSSSNYDDMLTGASAKFEGISHTGGSNLGSPLTTNTITNGTPYVGAFAMNTADYAAVLNAGTVATSSTAGTPQSPTTFVLGSETSSGTAPADSYITRVTIWNKRLTNAQAQGLRQ